MVLDIPGDLGVSAEVMNIVKIRPGQRDRLTDKLRGLQSFVQLFPTLVQPDFQKDLKSKLGKSTLFSLLRLFQNAIFQSLNIGSIL